MAASLPLWVAVLDRFEEVDTVGPHELDKARMKLDWKGLALIGELPSQAALRMELNSAERKQAWRLMRAFLLRVNTRLTGNPAHRFRRVRWDTNPLFYIDRLCEQHGLDPPERSLTAVTAKRTERLASAVAGTSDEYRAARLAMDASDDAFEKLRWLRVGLYAAGAIRYPDQPQAQVRPPWWAS